MGPDATTTKARLLTAACDEFARVGFAGARVDRIATAAASNVRMIYAHFGSKSTLFDTCFAHMVAAMAEAVPPRGDDLSEWAAELVEYHDRDPRALRISMWAQLERPESTAEPLRVYAAKVATVRPDLTPTSLRPADVLIMVYAIAQSWHLSPDGLVQHAATTTAERACAARVAVARILGTPERPPT